MATSAIQSAYTESELPLYQMDVGTYHRLIEAGALEGVEVELLDGLLINKWPHREDAVHRFDIGTFERIVATGEFEEQPIELLEGLLVEVSPHGPEHARVLTRLTAHLASARGRLGVQIPLEVEWGSLPEPDLTLTMGEPPRGRHPRTAMLAVEVAVTSQERDRDTKAPMYARAAVPVYWLVDVPAKTVEVRTEPVPDGYARCELYRPGAHVPSPAEGVGELDVATLFDGVGD